MLLPSKSTQSEREPRNMVLERPQPEREPRTGPAGAQANRNSDFQKCQPQPLENSSSRRRDSISDSKPVYGCGSDDFSQKTEGKGKPEKERKHNNSADIKGKKKADEGMKQDKDREDNIDYTYIPPGPNHRAYHRRFSFHTDSAEDAVSKEPAESQPKLKPKPKPAENLSAKNKEYNKNKDEEPKYTAREEWDDLHDEYAYAANTRGATTDKPYAEKYTEAYGYPEYDYYPKPSSSSYRGSVDYEDYYLPEPSSSYANTYSNSKQRRYSYASDYDDSYLYSDSSKYKAKTYDNDYNTSSKDYNRTRHRTYEQTSSWNPPYDYEKEPASSFQYYNPPPLPYGEYDPAEYPDTKPYLSQPNYEKYNSRYRRNRSDSLDEESVRRLYRLKAEVLANQEKYKRDGTYSRRGFYKGSNTYYSSPSSTRRGSYY